MEQNAIDATSYPVTEESIALAKAHVRSEREKVYRETGLVIDDDGHAWLSLSHRQQARRE